MVYIGKPSTGCSNCRTVKKRCDHGVPSCQRCLRKGVICGGYRDKLDLTFRDQTRQTIRKSNQAEHKVKSPAVAAQLVWKPMEAKPPGQLDESRQLAAPALSVPITDQAVSFFFHNFVLTDPISGGGHLEYLPVIYAGITRDLALPTAIIAIGIAGIANLRRNRDLMLAANAQYVLAIQLTQTALIDETLRLQDQTLVNILLLALYETIACCSPQSLRIWSNHVTGATALISQFAQQRLMDDVGIRIFSHLRSHAIIQALQRSQHIPDEIQRWSTKTIGLQSTSQAFEDQLHHLAIDLCSLRASVDNGLLTDGPTIISRASALDEKLADWSRRLSIEYGIAIDESLAARGTPNPARVRSYSDIHVSNAINCHTLRILTNELILNTLDQAKGDTTVDYQRLRSQHAIHTLTVEVCASVLLFTDRERQQAGFIARGGFLLWPLYVVSAVPWTSKLYRDWAIAQLKELGMETGILQAALIARVLQMNGEVNFLDKETNGERDIE
ncbi:hypothetical protein GGI42DRAFT_343080 [Trichoderma sp. SZMC 28013]